MEDKLCGDGGIFAMKLFLMSYELYCISQS
jgi:hypothetical protein